MITEINRDESIIEIWLTNEESQDPENEKKIRALSVEYRKKNFLVAVFISGKGNLTELTTGLLLHNR